MMFEASQPLKKKFFKKGGCPIYQAPVDELTPKWDGFGHILGIHVYGHTASSEEILDKIPSLEFLMPQTSCTHKV